jgi:imidazole glycerol-phosphate synthase subunit HisF
LIPVLFLQNGLMVRSERFIEHQVIGHPVSHVERLVQWDVDELIILDISRAKEAYAIRRDDHKLKGSENLLQFIGKIAESCGVPLSFGGQVRTEEDVRTRIFYGADKVIMNTVMSEAPEMIDRCARIYGSQAIVVSVDYRIIDGKASVFTHHASVNTGIAPGDWASRAEALGAGEIFLNAVDRDGAAKGYDIDTINAVTDAVEIPVIACGGAGHVSHFRQCFLETQASAVAAGNIFHFTENAYPRAKTNLRNVIHDIR